MINLLLTEKNICSNISDKCNKNHKIIAAFIALALSLFSNLIKINNLHFFLKIHFMGKFYVNQEIKKIL